MTSTNTGLTAIEWALFAQQFKEERDRLMAALEKAPHAEQCTTNGLHTSEDDCDCWKRDALEGK